MPRELTRQSGRQEAPGSHLEIEVKHMERTVRVTLSGILDRPGMARIAALVGPRLRDRGYRIVLDGSRLAHIDYRITQDLIRWNRSLRQFHHQLYLQNWSHYLKALLCMEDWDCELGDLPAVHSNWRLLKGTGSCSRP